MAGVDKPMGGSTTVQATGTPAFRIETAESRRVRYLKLMIYGNYGVGKTTLAATASEVESMRDVLMINSELGDLSLEPFDHVYSVHVPTYKVVSKVYDFLRAHVKAWESSDMDKVVEMEMMLTGRTREEVMSREEPVRFRTVIIDSLSEVDALSMNKVLSIDPQSTRLEEETNLPEWAEYKQNYHSIMRLTRAFRDLPMHVIYICGERFIQDELKRQKFSPDLTGQLSKRVQGFMDMVGYYQVQYSDGKAARRLNVVPTARYDAKHRYAAFKAGHFDDPTIGSILDSVGLLGPKGAAIE